MYVLLIYMPLATRPI